MNRHIFNCFIKAHGYNQRRLAEEIGMTRAQMSNRANGLTEFSVGEAKKIAAVLGVNLEELAAVL